MIVFNEKKMNEVAYVAARTIPQLISMYNRKPFPFKKILYITKENSTVRFTGKFILTSSENDDYFTLRANAGGFPVLQITKRDFTGALICAGVCIEIILKSGDRVCFN